MNFENLPSWAVSDEAVVWYWGFALGALVRITKAGLRWFKRIGAAEKGD